MVSKLRDVHLSLVRDNWNKTYPSANAEGFFCSNDPVNPGSPSGIALRPSPKNGPPDRFLNGSAVQQTLVLLTNPEKSILFGVFIL